MLGPLLKRTEMTKEKIQIKKKVKEKIIEYLSKFGKYPEEIKENHVMENLPDLYKICVEDRLFTEKECPFSQVVQVVHGQLELAKLMNGGFFEDVMNAKFRF